MRKCKLFAVLHGDIVEDLVWLDEKQPTARCILKITYSRSGQSRTLLVQGRVGARRVKTCPGGSNIFDRPSVILRLREMQAKLYYTPKRLQVGEFKEAFERAVDAVLGSDAQISVLHRATRAARA
jgi:hypothetical protein